MNYEPTNGLINVTMKHYTYSVFGFTFIQTVAVLQHWINISRLVIFWEGTMLIQLRNVTLTFKISAKDDGFITLL